MKTSLWVKQHVYSTLFTSLLYIIYVYVQFVPQMRLGTNITTFHISAFFKEFSLGGQNRKKKQNEKYGGRGGEPSGRVRGPEFEI